MTTSNVVSSVGLINFSRASSFHTQLRNYIGVVIWLDALYDGSGCPLFGLLDVALLGHNTVQLGVSELVSCFCDCVMLMYVRSIYQMPSVLKVTILNHFSSYT